jgi:hypothetical protein
MIPLAFNQRCVEGHKLHTDIVEFRDDWFYRDKIWLERGRLADSRYAFSRWVLPRSGLPSQLPWRGELRGQLLSPFTTPPDWQSPLYGADS